MLRSRLSRNICIGVDDSTNFEPTSVGLRRAFRECRYFLEYRLPSLSRSLGEEHPEEMIVYTRQDIRFPRQLAQPECKRLQESVLTGLSQEAIERAIHMQVNAK